MPRLLDERFLTVHPRTALWWAEREQCRQCKHHSYVPHVGLGTSKRDGGGGTGCGERCALAPSNGKTLSPGSSCIQAREERCGPEARLFEPRKAEPE